MYAAATATSVARAFGATDMSERNEPAAVVFVIDDDASVRDVLSMALSAAGYRVTAFADSSSFIAAAGTRSPACVVLDLYMPGKTGLDILREIDAKNYPAPILILSGRGDIPTAVKAMKAGAYDFMEKRRDVKQVISHVHEAIGSWAELQKRDGYDDNRLPWFPGRDKLTPREREVLGHIVGAASNKETAKMLGISPRTVEVHRVHIMYKLRAKNTADLVRIVRTV